MKLYIVSNMLILVPRSWSHFLLTFKYAVVIIFSKLERLHIFIPGQVYAVLTTATHPGKQIHNALFPFTQ